MNNRGLKLRKKLALAVMSFCLVLCMVCGNVLQVQAEGASSITVEDVTYHEGNRSLKSMAINFMWESMSQKKARMVLMTEKLAANDLSDMGTYAPIVSENPFTDINDVMNYDNTNHTFGIVRYSEETTLQTPATNEVTINFQESDVLLSEDKVYYVYMWKKSTGYYPECLCTVICVKDGVLNFYDEATFNQQVTLHEVIITRGANMTRVDTSGAEHQNGLISAMTPVVYTADSGYYFPENYTVETVNGITVTRDSDSQITVSGTPTDNTALTLTAPTAVVSVSGTVENSTDVNANKCNATLDGTGTDLSAKALTAEEQQRVAGGLNAQIWLQVVDGTGNATEADKTLVQRELEGAQVGTYLDLTLWKKLEGDLNATQVSNTNGAVSIKLKVPQNLINTDTTKTRAYGIIRVHDDGSGAVAEVLPSTYDEATQTVSFSTDKFSIYSLTYKDTDIAPASQPENAPAPQPGNASVNEPEENEDDDTEEVAPVATPVSELDDVPKTGDTSNVYLWILLTLVSGIAAFCFKKKATM